jgi:hypothetical protein
MTEMGLSVGERSSTGLEESGSCASGHPEIHVAVKSNIFFYDLEDVLAIKSALSIFPDALVGLKVDTLHMRLTSNIAGIFSGTRPT